jgi:hypothetical protein
MLPAFSISFISILLVSHLKKGSVKEEIKPKKILP